MTNAITPESIDDFLASWTADDWNILAVSADYVFTTADVNLSDVDAGVRIGDVLLSGRTITSAVFDADNALIPTAGGDELGGFWIYKDTGVEATSRLMLWIDTNADGTAIGGTTSADGIAVPWSSQGVFRIAAVAI